MKKSVNQLIKEASKPLGSSAKYDLVYCAGLFDYLPDQVCKRLMNIFYDLLAPGGLLVATNVDDSNPSKNWMEYALDWHLVYRRIRIRSEEHTSELQSRLHLVCRLLLEKKKKQMQNRERVTLEDDSSHEEDD